MTLRGCTNIFACTNILAWEHKWEMTVLINNVEEESVWIVGLQEAFEVYTESLQALCGLDHVSLDMCR